MSAAVTRFTQHFFHGTRADLVPGDVIVVGHPSNFSPANFAPGQRMSWVYCTATLDAAIWGAELATGEGRQRIYVVEPTGSVEDDPNLTGTKFAGNPTLSYRSRAPMRIVAEVVGWQGHPAGQIDAMRDALARQRADGGGVVID